MPTNGLIRRAEAKKQKYFAAKNNYSDSDGNLTSDDEDIITELNDLNF